MLFFCTLSVAPLPRKALLASDATNYPPAAQRTPRQRCSDPLYYREHQHRSAKRYAAR